MTALRSVLLRAQEEAEDTDATLRERARRAWHLAERRQQLRVLDKIRGATLFDSPIPDPTENICIYPGCGRPGRQDAKAGRSALCGSHGRQKSRNGLLYVTALNVFTPKQGIEGPCRNGHSGEVYRDRYGYRICRACCRERKRRARKATR